MRSIKETIRRILRVQYIISQAIFASIPSTIQKTTIRIEIVEIIIFAPISILGNLILVLMK